MLCYVNEVPRDWENVFVMMGACYKRNPVTCIMNLWENDHNLCYIGVWLIIILP